MPTSQPGFKARRPKSKLPAAFLLSLVICSFAKADSSITDARTPPELQVGSPAGSYALTGIEDFNPYTGSLNIHIPLYHEGGRGDAGYDIQLGIQQQWQAYQHANDVVDNVVLWVKAKSGIGTGSIWLPKVPSYSPGVVVSRSAVDLMPGSWQCTGGSNAGGYSFWMGEILTRLVFIDSVGTEHDLVDTLTNGRPLLSYSGSLPDCQQNPATAGTNRGTTFRAMDSSDLVFVLDSPIHDQAAFYTTTKAAPSKPVISGWLYFPSGKKYRVDLGYVTQIEDRNGNYAFNTDSTSRTDALNRPVQISATDPSLAGTDTITYPGVGGSTRAITITKVVLSSALLAPGQSLQTYGTLFPPYGTTSSTYNSPYTPVVVSSVALPDGSSYSFTYTSYGDVASITLPTGGQIVYTWPTALGGCDSFCVATDEDYLGNPIGAVYRRLLSRSEYQVGSSTPSRTTTYSYSYGVTGPYGPTMVTATDQDGNGKRLAVTKHHYFGDASGTDDLTAIFYNDPTNGEETLTEYLDGNGTTLRQTLKTWQQRPCSSTESCWFQQSSAAFLHDPQLASEQTTEGSMVRSVSYIYDANNNVTDEFDYDWGPGLPSTTPLRHTHTTFNRLAASRVPVPRSASFSISLRKQRCWMDRRICSPTLNIATMTPRPLAIQAGLSATIPV